MRMLVTGGAGFIGSNYVRHTLTGSLPGPVPDELVVLDKLTYAGNRANLAPVVEDPRWRLVVGDICHAPTVRCAMAGVDVVVHFAAESHVDRSISDAAAFMTTNVLGTHVLLQTALDVGVDRFVHVSTDEVYGSIEHGSFVEEHPLQPNSPYAASKAASELVARAFHRTHGLPVVITRCSNNYGPYQHPEKVIPLFLTNLLDDGTVPLYGDGRNVRDWLHVDDHCRGVALVAAGGRPGEVYNIGGGTELSNRDLTTHLLAVTGRAASAIRQVPDRLGHDLRYSVDITKIRSELGYAPRVTLEEGLRATAQWYRTNRAWWEPLKRSIPRPAA